MGCFPVVPECMIEPLTWGAVRPELLEVSMSKNRFGSALHRGGRALIACVLAVSMALSPVSPAIETALAAQPGGTGHVGM